MRTYHLQEADAHVIKDNCSAVRCIKQTYLTFVMIIIQHVICIISKCDFTTISYKRKGNRIEKKWRSNISLCTITANFYLLCQFCTSNQGNILVCFTTYIDVLSPRSILTSSRMLSPLSIIYRVTKTYNATCWAKWIIYGVSKKDPSSVHRFCNPC